MSNSFLDFVLKEADPMFDAAVITENGVDVGAINTQVRCSEITRAETF